MKIAIGTTVIIAFLVAAMSMGTFAQPPGHHKFSPEKKEKIEAMKISFLTKRLDLNREEAQAFWPVYNEFQNEMDQLRQQRREEFRNYRGRLDELSEEELKRYVDQKIIYRQRELDVEKKYHAAFKEALPIRKVAELYEAEVDFKLHLIREAKNRGRH